MLLKLKNKKFYDLSILYIVKILGDGVLRIDRIILIIHVLDPLDFT